jgi:DNA polymerase elongation subunit (family B)
MIYQRPDNFELTHKKLSLFLNQGHNIKPEQCIFLDIEVVRMTDKLDELNDKKKALFLEKIEKERLYIDEYKDKSDEWLYQHKAGLYAEYGKIVCISMGMVANGSLKVISFANNNEQELLEDFAYNFFKTKKFILKHNNISRPFIVGVNVANFDIAYIAKRMFKYGMIPDPSLKKINEKPWESNHIDIIDAYKMGITGYRLGDNRLDSMCDQFNIPSSKEGVVSGEKLSDYYWDNINKGNDPLIDIAFYCEDDVINSFKLFNYLSNLMWIQG